MDDLSQLEALGKVAGFGGAAVGLLAIVARSFLQRATRLTREQTFVVVILIVVATWSVSAFGVYAWWDVSRVAVEEQKSKEVENTTIAPATVEMLPTTTGASPVQTRKETLKLDLKKPIGEQIRLYDGDTVKLTGGAIGLIDEVNFGNGWKDARKNESYKVKGSPDASINPRFKGRAIPSPWGSADLIKAAKSAAVMVEIRATSKVDQSRKP